MLDKTDLDFLLQALDKVQLVGIQSALKASEVFVKLGKMRKELNDERSEIGGDSAEEEEVVSEPDNLA